jgi:glycosyltransferase involved in cell wall biosynthesis
VTTSVTEVHPLAVLEAIGAGLPVVGVRAPGVEDIVTHNVNGLLCGANPEEMAADLARLLQDPERLRSLAEGAARSAEDYSIETTARRTLEIYTRCLADRRRSPGRRASAAERLEVDRP